MRYFRTITALLVSLFSASCSPGDGNLPFASDEPAAQQPIVLAAPEKLPMAMSNTVQLPTPTPTPTQDSTTTSKPTGTKSVKLVTPDGRTIQLSMSGPVIATQPGQVISNLYIETTDTTPGITVKGMNNVKISNVIIRHKFGPGIRVSGSQDVQISQFSVVNTAAPMFGPHSGSKPADRVNIVISGSSGVSISEGYVEKGSSGIYALQSDNISISNVEGFDFRGPFPRGQFVQFDKCSKPVLDNFTVINSGATSWTEDVVNSFASVDPVIRNGYIEGVNSPTGHGIVIENGTGGRGGLVENVDVKYWVNGAFMAANGAQNVIFRNIGSYSGIAMSAVSDNAGQLDENGKPIPTLETWEGNNFRGAPTSGQQAFFAYKSQKALVRYNGAVYAKLPRRNRVAWDVSLMASSSFVETSSPPRTRYKSQFPRSNLVF